MGAPPHVAVEEVVAEPAYLLAACLDHQPIVAITSMESRRRRAAVPGSSGGAVRRPRRSGSARRCRRSPRLHPSSQGRLGHHCRRQMQLAATEDPRDDRCGSRVSNRDPGASQFDRPRCRSKPSPPTEAPFGPVSRPNALGSGARVWSRHGTALAEQGAPSPADLAEAVRPAHQRYGDRRPISAQLAHEAAAVMPGGNTRSVLHLPDAHRVSRWRDHDRRRRHHLRRPARQLHRRLARAFTRRGPQTGGRPARSWLRSVPRIRWRSSWPSWCAPASLRSIRCVSPTRARSEPDGDRYRDASHGSHPRRRVRRGLPAGCCRSLTASAP